MISKELMAISSYGEHEASEQEEATEDDKEMREAA